MAPAPPDPLDPPAPEAPAAEFVDAGSGEPLHDMSKAPNQSTRALLIDANGMMLEVLCPNCDAASANALPREGAKLDAVGPPAQSVQNALNRQRTQQL